MGATFNSLIALMQGGWIFWFGREVNPAMYSLDWLTSWQFIVGLIVFVAGFAINLHSDYIIRHLRKPGDTRHYIPRGGMFRFVSSANYFGELVEWTGFAILTASPAAWVFVWWTAANLVPRADAIHKKYRAEFGNQAVGNRKRILPFIY